MAIIADWLAQTTGPKRCAGVLPVGSMSSGMAIELHFIAVRGARQAPRGGR